MTTASQLTDQTHHDRTHANQTHADRTHDDQTHADRMTRRPAASRSHVTGPTAARGVRHVLAPTVGAGVAMAVYLVLRPYGDAAPDPLTRAAAFAAPMWVVAHVAGLLALASYARLALRVADLHVGVAARLARWAGLVGAMLALPYYGVEAVGLHVVARRALAAGGPTGVDVGLLGLVDELRREPIVLGLFGVGLLLLAVSGAALALAWRGLASATGATGARPPAWIYRAAWPTGLLMALFVPHYLLPPAGRIAYGLIFLAATALLAAAAWRLDRSAPAQVPTQTPTSTST